MNNRPRQLFLRKVRVGLTPRSALLRTRLQNGAIVEGYNRNGYGDAGFICSEIRWSRSCATCSIFLEPVKSSSM